MIRLSVVAVILSFLSACGPTKLENSFNFDSTNENSLLVVYDSGENKANKIIFVQTDLANSQFKDETETFLLCPASCGGMTNYNTFKLQQGPASYFAKVIPPGQYSPLAKWWRNMIARVRTCYSKGSYVFDFKPGTINLVNLNRLTGSTAMARQNLALILNTYPNINGDIVTTKPVAKIAFEEAEEKSFGEPCFPETGGQPIEILKRFDIYQIEARDSRSPDNIN
ncbi:MAG: hypothetical protein CMN56_14555 [Sneathiella sp.]|uniref:hypothetical protein n=1 Tax=Sneathiella sp. TaxID=1964365 RepID=UPI000C4D37F4|nr:hypothetical protein [Sneathiella sp.]MAZ04351.1 hypothetical protein [Sneathiella sp.]